MPRLAIAALALSLATGGTASAADGAFLAAGTTGGMSSSRLPSPQYVPRVGFVADKTVFYGTGGIQRMRQFNNGDANGGGALELGVGVRHSLKEPGKKKAGTFLLGQLQTVLTKGTDMSFGEVLDNDKIRTLLLGGGVEAQLVPSLTLSGELAWKQTVLSENGNFSSRASMGGLATGLFLNWRL